MMSNKDKDDAVGKLWYNGRRMDVSKFQLRDRNPALLEGECRLCGARISMFEAIPHVDPHDHDVYEDDTYVVQCSLCDSERADDV
jgi:hypothetical protein